MGTEFSPDSDLMIGFEGTLGKHLHQAALADTRVSYDDHFEDAVCLELLIRGPVDGLCTDPI